MVGHKLGHCRIVEKIGAGGMGEVYRARDEHLDRDVAVKVLPPGTLADEAARQRFRREALALGKLNHPNIQSVFDFDTQEGVDFLVTEYVPGVTLSEKLAAGPLPEKEEVRLGTQLAEGLAAAHEQGILHRDLKPSNLRVTPDGRLKILDFGVAKLLGPVSETAVTETGTRTLAGTPLYMSPEQRRGERADARSDLYSAGLVLWEMATGKPPSVAARGLSGRATPELQRIVEKSLEEDPENRYQSARELAVDLRRLATGSVGVAAPRPRPWWRRAVLAATGVVALAMGLLVGFNVGGLRDQLFGSTPQIDSIAVLPLENLSGDPEQEYFADGMTEALIADLSKIGALKVISRTSVMQYKGAKKPLPEIARELDVDAVIEGSVLREGDRVRVTVQLLDARADRHLWAERYERDLTSILALQSEVARAIANEIRAKLTPQEQTRLASARPVNPEAYNAYLLGRYFHSRFTDEDREKAVSYYQEAIQLDPGYAPAWAGLGHVHAVQAGQVDIPVEEGFRKARSEAQRALALDANLADAHVAMGRIQIFYDYDWAGADASFQRALALEPGNFRAVIGASNMAQTLGRFEEALALSRRAVELNPLAPVVYFNLGWNAYYAGRLEEAIAAYNKVLETNPETPVAHNVLGQIYLAQARPQEALAEMERENEHFWRVFGLTLAYHALGRKKESDAALAETIEKYWRGAAFQIAEAYAFRGEADRAFEWLDRAYSQHDSGFYGMTGDPLLKNIERDPRYAAFLKKMRLPM